LINGIKQYIKPVKDLTDRAIPTLVSVPLTFADMLEAPSPHIL